MSAPPPEALAGITFDDEDRRLSLMDDRRLRADAPRYSPRPTRGLDRDLGKSKRNSTNPRSAGNRYFLARGGISFLSGLSPPLW